MKIITGKKVKYSKQILQFKSVFKKESKQIKLRNQLPFALRIDVEQYVPTDLG